MFQVRRFRGEDDLLGDVGRVVPDALEMLGDEDHVDLLTGLTGHVFEAVDGGADQLIFLVVDLVVVLQDGPSSVGVEVGEGLDGVAERGATFVSQAVELRRQPDLGLRREASRAARDVPRDVADALQVRRDRLDRDDSGIARNRRVEGQDPEHGLVDLDVEPSIASRLLDLGERSGSRSQLACRLCPGSLRRATIRARSPAGCPCRVRPWYRTLRHVLRGLFTIWRSETGLIARV